MAKPVSEDIRFRMMRALEADPKLSQRDLARSLGISLGVVNYCLKGLIEKGQVKVGNFRASGNKLRYTYVLTPRGVLAKAKLTKAFLKRRMAEHEALIAEIEALQQEINSEVIGQGAPEDLR
ncbi:MarR family EPS-associated transcriptional regulator [Sulfitobacter sp. R18_1]|uniref:MarR family EPS-associated transcriptional regulator n=1 Tax=Sulfitobacter sp. R18_1 TaxID=2821104 RepID=UPI001ADB200A|nr:MarR family EPS-associated transcriptional regulator [Sulfitobacter sp. R18_1]MBO9432183.1 MarR family EPS-associated transcriptional regulator [Sulfitobacter sp. R18_1]